MSGANDVGQREKGECNRGCSLEEYCRGGRKCALRLGGGWHTHKGSSLGASLEGGRRQQQEATETTWNSFGIWEILLEKLNFKLLFIKNEYIETFLCQ